MRTSPLRLLFALVLAAFVLPLQATMPTPPPAPQLQLEWGPLNAAGEKQLYLCFHADAGVRYWVQQANGEDFNADAGGFPWSWTGDVYGLGKDVRVPVYTLVPPPVDPADPTLDTYDWSLPSVSMRLCPLADGQGLAVGWMSGYMEFTRQLFATTNTSLLPDTGFLHTDTMNFFWYKGETLTVDTPSQVVLPLNYTQGGQWTQIQAALPTILSGQGGVTTIPATTGVTVSGSAKSRFWRLQLEYPDSDLDGLPDWLELAGFLNASGVRRTSDPFAMDSDFDGVTDVEEWAAGTNPSDSHSHPYKVMAAMPEASAIGHPRDGAIVLKLNEALPESVTSFPQPVIRRRLDTSGNSNNDPVAVTTMILPGRKVVAFLPTALLDAGDPAFAPQNYSIAFNSATTGVAPLVAYESTFATVQNLDTIGPWVKNVSPGENYIDAAVDYAPVIEWSQPLHPDTVLPTNVTLLDQATSTPVTLSVSFNYETNRLTLGHSAALQPDTAYAVTLGTGFTNLMGKPLLNAFVWNFRTRPERAVAPANTPHVVSTTPADFSTGVNPSSTVTLTFSEAMDTSTLTAANIHLTANHTEVPATFSYNSSTHVLTLTPTDALLALTHHTLTLDATAIQSSASTPQPIGGNTTFVFTTGSVPTSGSGSGSGGGGGSGGGSGGELSSGGTADPEEPPPLVLHLHYGDDDDDAGASVMLEITTPEGYTRQQQFDAASNGTKEAETGKIPYGSTITATPQFYGGTDNDTEEEMEESAVTVSVASASENSGAAYVVIKQTDANPDGELMGVLSDGNYTAAAEEKAPITGASKGAGKLKVQIPEFTIVEGTWKTKVNTPTITYDGRGTDFEAANFAVMVTGNTAEFSAKVKVHVPGISGAAADNIVKNWDLVFYQNIVQANDMKAHYSLGLTGKTTVTPIPCQDANGGGSAAGDLPKVIAFTSNNQQLAISLEDMPSQRRPRWYNTNPLTGNQLNACSTNLQFISWLFARNRNTDERVYLKWVRWEVVYDVSLDFTKNPPDTRNVWRFQKLDEGDGFGTKKPSRTPKKVEFKFIQDP